MKRRHFMRTVVAVTTVLALPACDKGTPANVSAASAASGVGDAGVNAKTAAAPSARDAYDLAATGHGFSVGPVMAAHTVYVFFDTTCPHCAQLWKEAKPLLGKLKMVWMPVGLLRQQSAPQGATILAAPNPAEAMAENEASVLQGKGGITADISPNAEALDKVKANNALFGKLGADSVPLIVFKNARTGEYGTRSGSVPTAELAALAGV